MEFYALLWEKFLVYFILIFLVLNLYNWFLCSDLAASHFELDTALILCYVRHCCLCVCMHMLTF
jgi:hypothetical protein